MEILATAFPVTVIELLAVTVLEAAQKEERRGKGRAACADAGEHELRHNPLGLVGLGLNLKEIEE